MKRQNHQLGYGLVNTSLIKGSGLALILAGCFFAAHLAYGATPGEENVPGKAAALAPAARETNEKAERHLSKAEHYRQEAQSYQEEIKRVWKDYAAESKKIATLPKSAVENPYVKKLRLQAESKVKELEAQADEAQDMARYHRLRAREAQDEKLFSKLK